MRKRGTDGLSDLKKTIIIAGIHWTIEKNLLNWEYDSENRDVANYGQGNHNPNRNSQPLIAHDILTGI